MVGHMGSCQNYGPFLGTLNSRCRIIIGTIILTTTHMKPTSRLTLEFLAGWASDLLRCHPGRIHVQAVLPMKVPLAPESTREMIRTPPPISGALTKADRWKSRSQRKWAMWRPSELCTSGPGGRSFRAKLL